MAEADAGRKNVTSDSDSDVDNEEWVLYRDRPEWKDVEPVTLDEGSFPVVAIAYSEKFKDVHNYLRAVILSNEISERALKLTADAVDLNPANYTTWQYRRLLIKTLNKDLRDELAFVRTVIEENPKNYQVWHHRRVLVEWLGDPKAELRFTEIILSQDSKNYHAWQHRQWVLHTYKLFEKELEYVESLLEEDVRNNSAWNQRYFVITNTTGYTADVLTRELEFTKKTLQKVKDNESAWNYLRGILEFHEGGLNGHPVVEELCEYLASHNCRISHYLAFLVDRLEEKMTKKIETENSLKQSFELLQDLATEADPIRIEYWQFLSRQFQNEFGQN
nr:EOG090X08PK [Eulimnadia texana]